MNVFTVSGSLRLACLLMNVSDLSTNFMLYSLLALFFICANTFSIWGGVPQVWGGLQQIWAGVLVVTRLLFAVAFD